MSHPWRWAGACAIGTSHRRSGIECQDRASCAVVQARAAEYLSIVVSDGAGSASQAARGAAIVCGMFQRRAVAALRAGRTLEQLDARRVAGWVDEIRERIRTHSAAADLRPRDFAATLIAVLVGPEGAVVVHVGDGAAVLHRGGAAGWTVPSWPFRGEYVSTTRFVIDEPCPPIEPTPLAGCFDRAVVFSDGLEDLVLDHRARVAPASFFDRLSQPVASSASRGRDRRLSRHLRCYLDSDKVCAATDDDKSLIIGARM